MALKKKTVNQKIHGTVTYGSGTSDHNRLVNREKEKQHPIDAIEDLREELDAKLDSKTALPLIQEAVNGKGAGLYYDAKKELARKAYWYITSEIDPKTKQGTKESIISGPYDLGQGGGGGGGGVTTVIIRQLNWPATVIAGARVELQIEWSSTYGEEKEPTGNGTVYVSVNGKQVLIRADQPQGIVTFDVSKFLTSGANTVQVSVLDAYGTTGLKVSTINVVNFELQSNFDDTRPYTERIPFTYIPYGNIEKTVYFIVDGVEVGRQVVTASGDQQTYYIRSLTHGSHTLEVYFTAEIDGSLVTSNTLRYDLIYYIEGDTTPIIASSFDANAQYLQYMSFNIPYVVFIQGYNRFNVDLIRNEEVVKHLEIGAGQQYWEIREDVPGIYDYKIKCGDVTKEFTVTVTKNEIPVVPESQDLVLDLATTGRSNTEPIEERTKWIDSAQDINCELVNFNWASNGWVKDAANNTVLRISGDARVTIPYKPFEADCKLSGKTIELEIATSAIRDYSTTIISCLDGLIEDSTARGFYITPQIAVLRSQQSAISTQYKEDDHIHLAFVIESTTKNRIIWMYINGIASGAVQYPNSDVFSQIHPVNIILGSSDATLDIYNIRIYDQGLEGRQVVNNWISNTQDMVLKAERYYRNNIYDPDTKKITVNMLPAGTPYIIWDIDPLPISKDDRRPGNAKFVDQLNPSRSFEAKNAEFRVQGTSSAQYPVKNIRTKYKQIKNKEVEAPFEWYDNEGNPIKKYAVTEDGIKDNYFTYKVDFASSEGANNVELVKLYNDACRKAGILTPPQKRDATGKVRVGIDGFPIIAFWQKSNGEIVFNTKANFNNDKNNHDVFGLSEGDESFETTNNTAAEAKYQSPVVDQDTFDAAFEWRYPEDGKGATLDRIKEMTAWVASTYRRPEDSDAEKAEKLAKFKNELADYFNVRSTLFYYLFTELFLMVDSRAKNAFPTFFISKEEGDGGDRWFWLPYDMDTAIGINNEGKLVFDYSLEDTDKIDGSDVFNGQDSVMWNNVRDAFKDELADLYKSLRNDRLLDFDYIEKMFEEHQGKWPENIFNEDAKVKYVDPFKQGDNYLEMLQGAKAEQRRWWLYNRFRYLDSKYNAGEAKADNNIIHFRAYGEANTEKPNLTITPYADIYATASFRNGGAGVKSARAKRNEPKTLESPYAYEEIINDQEVQIYSASQIKSIGDISGFYPDTVKIGAAIKLQDLKVGDGDPSYRNTHLTSIELGNNTLLKTLDIRNCVNLGATSREGSTPQQSLDLTKCTNIEEVYLTGTKLTGVEFSDGGNLKKVYLPATLKNLRLSNQRLLEELVFEEGALANLQTICLENLPANIININDILDQMTPGYWVRFIGIEATYNNYEDIVALYDKLDLMKGIDASGAQVSKAQVTGTIHLTKTIPYADYEALKARYSEIEIDAVVICTVIFKNDGIDYNIQNVIKGESATRPAVDPTKESDAQYDYTFVGWDHALTNIQEDLVINAIYDHTTRIYTVKFHKMSELAHIEFTEAQVEYNNSVKTPWISEDLPEIEFTGWFDDNGYQWEIDEETRISVNKVLGNVNLYAHWKDENAPIIDELTRKDYGSVNFEAHDNFGIIGYGVSFVQGQAPETWLPLPETVELEEGTVHYVGSLPISQEQAGNQYFWIKDNGGPENEVEGESPILTYSLTKDIPYGVDLEIKEGSELVDKSLDILTNNTELTVKLIKDLHYENFAISCDGNPWSIDEENNLTLDHNAHIDISCNPRNYTIKFDVGSEHSAVHFDDQQVDYAQFIARPAEQYHEGEIIKDWYTDSEFTNKWNFDDRLTDIAGLDLIHNDTVTLYAEWVEVVQPTIITINIPDKSDDHWIGNQYVIEFNYYQSKPETIRVNFDYEADPTAYTDSSIESNKQIIIEHPYTAPGTYKIAALKVDPTGTFKLGNDTLDNNEYHAIVYPNKVITDAEFSPDVATVSNGALSRTSITQLKLTDFFRTIPERMCEYSEVQEIVWARFLTEIGTSAFYYCSNLAGELVIPDSVTTIKGQAFSNCSSLTALTIGANVSIIEPNTFGYCTRLASINFANVTEIRNSAFNFCSSLIRADIPATVQSISANAFFRCTNLEKVILRNNNLVIDGGGTPFPDCTKLLTAGPIGGSYNIEFAWDERIPDYAFLNTVITNVTLPLNTLLVIGEKAFMNCNLTSIDFGTNTTSHLTEIGNDAFAFCNFSITENSSVFIPATVTKLGHNIFNQASFRRFEVHSSFLNPKIDAEEKAPFNGITQFGGNCIHIPATVDVSTDYGEYFNYSSLATFEGHRIPLEKDL